MLEYGEGFYDEERYGPQSFRWMGRSAALRFEPGEEGRTLELRVFSPFFDLSQTLTLTAPGSRPRKSPLLHGEWTLCVPVPAGADRMSLEANKLFPREYYPSEPRELSVMVFRTLLHSDAERARHVSRQWKNALLNRREMLAGKTWLESTPPVLGVDLAAACNVKPPCVFCHWDDAKAAEGRFADGHFDARALGPFFDRAASVISCGVGEPFLKKDLDEVLDEIGRKGKLLEIATNGQLLTEANIRSLVGRDIRVYFSLDAATAGTYARLRNEAFGRVIENVRRLVQAKGGRHRLPLVYLVFMPMRVNLHELGPFVRLCSELQADLMVLRPISDDGAQVWDRSGYHFDYRKELLSPGEYMEVSMRAAELCRQAGVPFSSQLDLGEAAPPPAPKPSLGESRMPLCVEPWRNFYILRRGITPCCFGMGSLAPMDRFKEVWNSPKVQSIRFSLLEGRLHEYCLGSPYCPVVKKARTRGDVA